MSNVGPVVSQEVLELVHIVERLATEDQERILKIVQLLTLVPTSVQRETQRRLSSLVDQSQRSMLDCVSAVDDVIDYLETCLIATHEPIAPNRLLCSAVSRRRN